MSSFKVVKFIEENTLATVSSTWISLDENLGEMCYWPPYKGPKKIHDAVLSHASPDSSWELINIKTLYTTDCYKTAINKEKKACYTSDLLSDGSELESNNKRKRPQYSSDEEPTRIPPPPIITSRTSTPPTYLQPNCIQPSSSQYTVPNYSHTPKSVIPSASSMSRDEIFQKKVLRILEKIQQDVKELKEAAANSKKQNPLPQLPSGCPKFPCENPEDLAELENILKDESVYILICGYLSLIGGSSVKDTTRRVLHHLISNSLSLKYNWKGTRGVKLAFSNFTFIVKLILGAVRKNINSNEATEQEIQNVIKKWLMHAKDREGGRNARALCAAESV